MKPFDILSEANNIIRNYVLKIENKKASKAIEGDLKNRLASFGKRNENENRSSGQFLRNFLYYKKYTVYKNTVLRTIALILLTLSMLFMFTMSIFYFILWLTY